ncbi:hypothetical protein PT974_12052 [Cladobotryum mycophilum]|uniref:Pentatricopeptide repeat protein n=1 Tax=Cladobotryum mycophilum TaxID=491253 RepID=A0ABR0S7Y3_9HYPO
MASTNPVPSRAALNALRGVLFTTSCSVILLAEERRRRLNIARAAIDNAKKLHTIRSNRGPIALSEGWEGRTSEPGDGILSLSAAEQPKSSYRRRRRDDLTNYILNDPDFEIHRHYSDHIVGSRVMHANVDAKPRDAQAVGISMDSFQPIRPAPQRLRHDFSLKSLEFFTPSTLFYYAEPMCQASGVEKDDRRTADESRATLQAISRLPTPTPANQDSSASLSFQDTVATLEGLLQDLGTENADPSAASQLLDKAVMALQELASVQPSTPRLNKLLKSRGLEVLKRAVELNATKVPAILTTLLPKSRDGLSILTPFVRWLQERDDTKELEKLLEFMTDRKQSRFWIRGMLIYRLLSHRIKIGGTYEQIKELYRMFPRAGLFGSITIPRETEYKIRRFVFSRALEANDDAFAQTEMRAICELDPEAARVDVKLQGRIIAREASLGHWDAVRDGLDALIKFADTKSSEFQNVLSRITNIFAQQHSAKDLEDLLRGFVCHYGIPLKHRWINSILDQHASHHELDSMYSWLKFCKDNGLEMNDGFIQNFYSRCRKYWSFSDKSIATLHQSIEQSIPISQAHLLKSKDNNNGTKPMIDLESVTWVSELDALEYMESLSAHSKWERLCEAYTKLLNSNLAFSASCLRLAVIGHIRRDDEGIAQASSLIDEARAQGHDITEALTPLLLARLERGEDASALIKGALQQGIRIHDSVYNKAAQAISSAGDLRSSAELCEIAAKENGNGELLYNEYNFSNLIFAYTGSARYNDLGSILSKFMSKVQWWRGSSTCKESIKLAMKTTAMRAVVNPEDKGRHERALFRLDEALMHVKKCRATREDRRAVTEAFIRVVRPPGKAEVAVQPLLDSPEVEERQSQETTQAESFHKAMLVTSQSLMGRQLVASGEV